MRVTSSGSGIRANLLDVQTPAGNTYYWADHPLTGIVPVIPPANNSATVTYSAWLLTPPAIKRTRSMQTDTGTVTLQNLSGDTLARDFECILRQGVMEGALCVYRFWNIAAETADLEFHCRVSGVTPDVSTATTNLLQLLDGSADTPGMQLSETCQLDWGKARCGATGAVECKYSIQTCQVQERFIGITNTFYDKNYYEAIGTVPVNVVNRRRTV